MSGSHLESQDPSQLGRARLTHAFGRGLVAASFALSTLALAPSDAQACGGFFCSATNPVNQAAEHIVFAQNGDGTVTAVIEIQYQGPAEQFSWLLPISSVPMGDEIAVASNAALQRLKQATNPQYNLTVRVEGTCDEREFPQSASNDSSGSSGPGINLSGGEKGVTVEAQGVVGSFEWTAISVDEALADPADVATTWLRDNGYDVPEGAAGLLRPYLEEGLYLLALKLVKGADVGSIRPIVLTYDAELPMIPIKLTAVAANEDMGVLAWLLGDAQAVPKNYNSLELNEARINWFNANANYNQVVSQAADDAGGHGFVTEMAGATAQLKDRIWSQVEENDFASMRTLVDEGRASLYQMAASRYSQLDGFWESLEPHAVLPSGVTLQQIKGCPFCYAELTVAAAWLEDLDAMVLEPMRLVQRLVDAHPQVTRLYTTMSASDMTVDPLFTFNADLRPVSNIHSAERVIECAPGYFQEEAPWRIELPQGGVIRGTPSDVGTWPSAFDAQPANRRVVRQGESGKGKVLEDNGSGIDSAIQTYSASVPTPARRSNGGCQVGGTTSGTGFAFVVLGLGAWLSRNRRRH
jgi:hypothetical protein